MGYRLSSVWSIFKLYINVGDAPSSTATNLNTEDQKLLLERIQGILNFMYCQKIKSVNCGAKLLGLKSQFCNLLVVWPFSVMSMLICKMGDKNRILLNGLRIKWVLWRAWNCAAWHTTVLLRAKKFAITFINALTGQAFCSTFPTFKTSHLYRSKGPNYKVSTLKHSSLFPLGEWYFR